MLEYDKKKDEKYLEGPLLDAKFVITKDLVLIQTENTGFVNCRRVTPIVQKDFLDMYKNVVKLAKENAVVISRKNQYRKYVVDNWSYYMKCVNEYNQFFDTLRKKAKEVEKRGIHLGSWEDYFLNECINLSYELSSYFWTTSPIIKMQSIYREFEKLESTLKTTPNTLFKIYI